MPTRPAFIVGLTGGIASGKSTVGRLFSSLGVIVVDADAVAREVVEPGGPALEAITARFGSDVLDAEGRLDRAGMRRRIFADSKARADLEAILHPRIRERMDAQLDAARSPYAIAMIPLLLETAQEDRFHRILVVDTPRDTQIHRARARDGSTLETLEGILEAQVDRNTRLRRADDVIHNDADMEHLRAQVQRLHERYLAEAVRLRADHHQ